MRERRDAPRRRSSPASFFRRDHRRRRLLTPEERGFQDGLEDRHYFRFLNFSRAADWILWMRGWRAGQEELRRRDFKAQGYSLRSLGDYRQLPLFPPENRQLPSTTKGSDALKKAPTARRGVN
jgi:hypothetical protein